MKKPSEYVRVRRSELERIVRELREISEREKATHLQDPADAYAYAFGQSRAQARIAMGDLEHYLNA